jgi:hypothetical protein
MTRHMMAGALWGANHEVSLVLHPSVLLLGGAAGSRARWAEGIGEGRGVLLRCDPRRNSPCRLKTDHVGEYDALLSVLEECCSDEVFGFLHTLYL